MSYHINPEINTLILNLKLKVDEIYLEGKTPIIFYLIGSYPYSNLYHQTPPIIQKYLEFENVSPIVIAIDPEYKNNPRVLSFLVSGEQEQTDHININIRDNQWYYPTIINHNHREDKTKTLSLNYYGRVAYCYLSCFIEENELKTIIESIRNENKEVLSLVFSFTGFKYFQNIEYRHNKHNIEMNEYEFDFKDNSSFRNPNADCMADIINDIDYNPPIELVSSDSDISIKNKFRFIENINLEYILENLKISFKKKNALDIIKYNSFAKTYIIKTLSWLKSLKSWETQIRLNDPLKKVSINKNSSYQEWEHFKYRVGSYLDIKHIREIFNQSSLFTLEQFINNLIYDIGVNIIDIIIIQNKLELENKENISGSVNIQDKKKYDYDFHIKKREMISSLADELNLNLDIVPFKFPKIFEQYINNK